MKRQAQQTALRARIDALAPRGKQGGEIEKCQRLRDGGVDIRHQFQDAAFFANEEPFRVTGRAGEAERAGEIQSTGRIVGDGKGIDEAERGGGWIGGDGDVRIRYLERALGGDGDRGNVGKSTSATNPIGEGVGHDAWIRMSVENAAIREHGGGPMGGSGGYFHGGGEPLAAVIGEHGDGHLFSGHESGGVRGGDRGEG